MNWEAVGAIGEVVGAIAVVATLGYFGFQIRAEARRARIEANRDRASRIAASTQAMADSDHLVPMMVNLLRSSGAPSIARLVSDATGLVLEDAVRYGLMRQGMLHSMQSTFTDPQVDSEVKEATRRSLARSIAQDGEAFAILWARAKDQFVPSFVEVVDKELEKLALMAS